MQVLQNSGASLRSIGQRAAVIGLTMGGAASAFAEGATTFDASSYAAQITAAIAGILVVGGAVFGLMVAIKSTKWARRAL